MATPKSTTSKKTRKKIFILGGGLSGLVAADKLKKNFDVIILEGAPFLGGLASSFKLNGEEIPRFNHHIVRSNKTTLKYLEKYKLLGKSKWQRIKMALGYKGKLHNINNPFGLLKFGYLTLWGKFRFGLFGLYAIFFLNPDKIHDNKDLDSWMDIYAGQEVKEKIWKELYGRNKFNTNLKKISAKQFAHRLFEKEGYDQFIYPEKGLQGMINGLEKDLKTTVKVYKSTKILEVDYKNNKIRFENNKKDYIENFDIVINTIPIPELLKRSKGLPEEYKKNLSRLKYVPVVGLAFGTEKYLDKNMYWINLLKERVHVIYQHSLLTDRYKSKVTWCVRYGGSEEDIGKSDEEIKKVYLETIKKYAPNMKVKWCLVFREKYAEPIYDKDYPNYCPKYDSPLKSLYHAGIQVTFPKIRNMNVALESGEKVAEIIMERFNNKK
jgi:protoporphyrinogen oxidase